MVRASIEALDPATQAGFRFLEMGDFGQAKGSFSKSLQENPEQMEALYGLIHAYLVSGGLEQAKNLLHTAKKDNGNQASVWFMEGLYLLNKGELNSCVLAFEKSILIDASYEDSYYYKAQAHMALEEWDKAAYNLTQCLLLKPDFAFAHASLGYLLILRGFWQAGLFEIFHGLNLDPSCAFSYRVLGEWLEWVGEKEAAKTFYEKALVYVGDSDKNYFIQRIALLDLDNPKSSQPDFKNPIMSSHYAFLRGDLKKAESILKNLIQDDSMNFEAYYNLGVIYEKNKDFHQAIEAYEKSIQISSEKDERPYNQLGVLYLEQDRLEEAEKYLLKAHQINSVNHSVLYNLSICYKKMNQMDGVKHFVDLLEQQLAPDNELLWSAKDLLL